MFHIDLINKPANFSFYYVKVPSLIIRVESIYFLVNIHSDINLAGGIDPGETSMEAAVRETEEEAGVKGRIVCEIGVYYDEISS